MQSGDDSLWESFPHALETLEGVRRYISAFRAPLEELSTLSPAQIHALRACSLLAIPPPPERMPPWGGFPTDLSELNLLGWAALVQDVAAGLLVLPPNMGRDMGLQAVALLQLLEASTGVRFCCYCCRPGLRCTCIGASPQVPPASWSQVVEQTPGCGVTASSGGMTTPSTSVAGMPGYVAPLPGITPPDFSNWSLPPPGVPLPRGLPTALQGLSHVGRSIQVRAAVERQARAQLVQGPRGLVQPTQTQPMPAPCTPQMALPLRQPPPGQPATLYQQAVQLPGKSTGRGVTSNPSIGKTAPTGSPSSQDCRRPTTRGWGDGGQSASHPRGCQRKMFQQWHLKVPHLSQVASQGLCPVILRDWLSNSIVRGGRRTLSICSGSTISITPPSLGRQNGYGSGISSSHTSSCTRRRHWVSRKDAQWSTCHT